MNTKEKKIYLAHRIIFMICKSSVYERESGVTVLAEKDLRRQTLVSLERMALLLGIIC